MSRPRTVAAAACALAVLLAPRSAAAFRNVALGDELRDRVLPTLDGGAAALLGQADASVFLFFRPGQAYSQRTLALAAALEDEFAGKPVRFVAVTSASYDRAEVRRMVRAAGIRMPVLLDEGDALYGELGVRSHPVAGVADARHRLAGFQHFVKINMQDALRGRIAHVLGELDVAELEQVLDPAPSGPAVAKMALPGPDAMPLPPDHFATARARACAAVAGSAKACAPMSGDAGQDAVRLSAAR
jgi:hypothetical protein